MVKKNNKYKRSFLSNLRSKVTNQGLLTSLILISILGFALNTFTVFTGKDLFGTFAYASVLLGLGLIFESSLFSIIRRGKLDEIVIPKLITFLVGIMVFIGGLFTIPFLHVTVGATLAGVIGFANVVAIFVLLYELFFIK